jgi:hypothetical protein
LQLSLLHVTDPSSLFPLSILPLPSSIHSDPLHSIGHIYHLYFFNTFPHTVLSVPLSSNLHNPSPTFPLPF